MKILVVNDDGIKSDSLKALVELLDAEFGYCYLAIPKDPVSASSHAITIKEEINYQEIEPLYNSERTVLVEGFPADCVRVGLNLYGDIFDLVISGVNQGPNLGMDIIYSGTVAGAREAVILGHSAIAISAPSFLAEKELKENLLKVLKLIIEKKLYQEARFLNVNIPVDAKKIIFAAQGERIYYPVYTKTKNQSFKIDFSITQPAETKSKDGVLYRDNYIVITPLQYDQTDEKLLKKFQKDKDEENL